MSSSLADTSEDTESILNAQSLIFVPWPQRRPWIDEQQKLLAVMRLGSGDEVHYSTRDVTDRDEYDRLMKGVNRPRVHSLVRIPKPSARP
jgi:hypothetical protein